MRIREVTYGRTVSRDFQSRRLELSAEVAEGESHEAVKQALIAIVDQHFAADEKKERG